MGEEMKANVSAPYIFRTVRPSREAHIRAWNRAKQSSFNGLADALEKLLREEIKQEKMEQA